MLVFPGDRQDFPIWRSFKERLLHQLTAAFAHRHHLSASTYPLPFSTGEDAHLYTRYYILMYDLQLHITSTSFVVWGFCFIFVGAEDIGNVVVLREGKRIASPHCKRLYLTSQFPWMDCTNKFLVMWRRSLLVSVLMAYNMTKGCGKDNVASPACRHFCAGNRVWMPRREKSPYTALLDREAKGLSSQLLSFSSSSTS